MVQISKLSDGRHICHTCGSSTSTCVCLTNFILILLLLLSCWIVIYYILWSLCSCWLVWALFSCCSLELVSYPSSLLWPSNFSTKNRKSCKTVFCSSDYLSTSSMRSSYAFCIHLISFLLFDIMSRFQVLSKVEPTLQSQVLKNNYQCWVKVFQSLSFLWFVVIVNVGKITDQEIWELDCSVQLRRTLHGNVWWLVGRFNFTTDKVQLNNFS